MSLKAIVFDLDGTLLDTLVDLADSVNRSLTAEALPPLPADSYRMLVGSGARNLVMRAAARTSGAPVDELSDLLIERLLASFNTAYEENWARQTRPYPGIEPMLRQFAGEGIRLAVLSNKPDDFTRRITRHFFPPDTFQAVYGKKAGWPLKPDPALTLEILRILAVKPDEAALVGDSGSDMQTAVRAGLLPVGVRWGFREIDELLAGGARYLANQPQDLIKILAGDFS